MAYNTLIGYIDNIEPVQIFPRENRPPLKKQILALSTKDNQKLFVEIRENNFEKINFMRVGMPVEIKYRFYGSHKNGKNYNNIGVKEINVI